MLLPFSDNAFVSLNKLTNYLLNINHAEGGSKAAFFNSFGYNHSNVHQFNLALLHIAKTEQVTKTDIIAFGTKYIIDGILQTLNGRNPLITTVWIIEYQSNIPKLVTAYPK